MALLDQKQFIANTLAQPEDTHAVNPYFLGVQPSSTFYETYGISGCSTVFTRKGQSQLQNLIPGDELISRTFGFVKPIGVLRSVYRASSPDAPESVLIGSEFFGASAPQADVIVGSKAEVQVGISRKDDPRPHMTSFDMDTCRRMFSNFRCNKPRLFVPVFEQKTSILVQGVYVVCPSLDDLAASFMHPSKNKYMN